MPLCWVLMPDHLHLVLTLGESESLAHAMNRIKSVTSREAQRVDPCHGPLWMAGFHDRALRRDADVEAAMGYVLMNPVRAGLVDAIDAYAFRWCGVDVVPTV